MEHLEGSGTPVLYIRRKVLKGEKILLHELKASVLLSSLNFKKNYIILTKSLGVVTKLYKRLSTSTRQNIYRTSLEVPLGNKKLPGKL
jgi:hypothetical protein